MKSVDITLLIQVVNFFVAYWFLRRYVFSPVAQILEGQELQDAKLQTLIQSSLAQRDAATSKMKQRMLQIKQKLQGSIPFVAQDSVINSCHEQYDGTQERVVLSEQEIKKVKKIISDSVSEVKL